MGSSINEVTLEQMLEAREKRSIRQKELLHDGHVLVSFSMNIAGPVKYSPLIEQGFNEGCRLIEDTLSAERIKILSREDSVSVTGCESLMLVDCDDAVKIKSSLVKLEDRDSLGRLFDIDVISASDGHISRSLLGLEDRPCLVCGAPGKTCACRRLHSVAELQKRTTDILAEHFRKKNIKTAAGYAAKALLYEVAVTPKPGLVDRNNSGSHKDMDFYTFIDSIVSLVPYFERCIETGMEMSSLPPSETFARLRSEGKLAEGDMKRATNGVNSHKGAIFSLGIICGAVGRLSDEYGLCTDTDLILSTASEIAREEISRDFEGISENSCLTAGESQFIKYGLRGNRGQVLDGFPGVKDIGLPWLEKSLAVGLSVNDAGAVALLYLIAGVDDGCIISRSSREAQQSVREELQGLLSDDPMPDIEVIKKLDDDFIAANMSPGGCADLLAISYMLLFLKNGI